MGVRLGLERQKRRAGLRKALAALGLLGSSWLVPAPGLAGPIGHGPRGHHASIHPRLWMGSGPLLHHEIELASRAAHRPMTPHAAGAREPGGHEMQMRVHAAGGQAPWPLNLKIPPGIRLEAVNGLLPDTPLVHYLEWRRSLNPARFDHFHPQIGPELAQDLLLRSTPTLPTITVARLIPPARQTFPPTSPAYPQVPGPPIAPSPPVSPHVPEPSTAALGLGLVASAAWLRRRMRPVG